MLSFEKTVELYSLSQIGNGNLLAFTNQSANKWLERQRKNPGSLYNRSKNMLSMIKRGDARTWLYLQMFMVESSVNSTIQQAKNDWKTKTLPWPAEMTLDDGEEFSFIGEYILDWGYKLEDVDTNSTIAGKTLLQRWPSLELTLQLPPRYRLKEYMMSLYNLVVNQMEPLEEDITVYRGYYSYSNWKKQEGTFSKKLDDFVVGEENTNWSFVSTSIDPRVAAEFVSEDCCIMIIRVPAGTPAILLSSIESDDTFTSPSGRFKQAEILLPPGLIFRFDKLISEKQTFTSDSPTRSLDKKPVTVTVTVGEFTIVGREVPILY